MAWPGMERDKPRVLAPGQKVEINALAVLEVLSSVYLDVLWGRLLPILAPFSRDETVVMFTRSPF